MIWSKIFKPIFKPSQTVVGLDLTGRVGLGIRLTINNQKVTVEDYWSFSLAEGDQGNLLKKVKSAKVLVVGRVDDLKQKINNLESASPAKALVNVFVPDNQYYLLIDLKENNLLVAENHQVVDSLKLEFSLLDLSRKIGESLGLDFVTVMEKITTSDLSVLDKNYQAMVLPWCLYLDREVEKLLNRPSRFDKQILLIDQTRGLKLFLQSKHDFKIIEGDILANLAYNLTSIPNIPKPELLEYRLALGAGLEALVAK